jgi:hypothetical protein
MYIFGFLTDFKKEQIIPCLIWFRKFYFVKTGMQYQVLGKQRQEDYKFEASPTKKVVRLCIKIKIPKQQTKISIKAE